MATLVGTQADPVDLLHSLCELDFDAIEAYEAAIARISDQSFRNRLIEFKGDHERHTRDLSNIITNLGGRPPHGPDIKRVLTKGKVVIGKLVGDRGILMAMKTNEEDTNTAYERAISRGGFSDDVRRILVINLEDERRHRAWIIQALQTH